MTALQDESVQKLGVIFVWNIMSEFSGGYDYEADRLAIQTAAAVPARPVARYLIFKCNLWKQVIEVLNHMISPYLRARTRSIHGCHEEVMYSLECLGIPCDSIPTDDGRVILENQKQWIAQRKRTERTEAPSDTTKTKRRVSKRRKVCV
jgi:hypothetical protein